ncbi:MAG: hypothetical protein ACREOH_21590, partial [Candidatus Entotheonellia bacterium]
IQVFATNVTPRTIPKPDWHQSCQILTLAIRQSPTSTTGAARPPGDVVFAWWDATLTFKTGVAFGPVITKRPFTVCWQGICRFKVNASGRFAELDVYHETSTPFRLAQAAAE